MTKFNEKILNALIDKYERSKTFSGENAVRQSFEVKPGKMLPRYKDDADYDYFAAVNAAVAELKEKGFVEVARKGDVVRSVRLKIGSLEEAYRFLGRRAKKSTNDELRVLLRRYEGCNDFLERFCNEQCERIAANKSVRGFDGDFESFENMLKVLASCFDVQEETFRRDFSARVLGDSKAFDKISTKTASVIWEDRDQVNYDFADKETIFEDLNIVRNPGHVFFKGNAVLKFRGQTPGKIKNEELRIKNDARDEVQNRQSLDLGCLGGDVALSSNVIGSLECIDVRAAKVMTIENLTTFNAFNDPDVFAIYLGGFHNTVRRELICKVFEQNPDKTYLHYGDIDAGGFHILMHLRRKTGIPFVPFRMDVETLAANSGRWKTLTENDRSRLCKFSGTEFADVAQFMLDNNCKLEQEQLD